VISTTIVDEKGESYLLYTLSGAPRIAALPILPPGPVDGAIFWEQLAGRRRLKEQSLRPPNERSVRVSRTTLYKKVADAVGL